MNISDKIVITFPIEELWKADKILDVKRGIYITKEIIRKRLKESTVTFVIADVGLKLEWIAPAKSFDFWKDQIRQNVADDLENIPLEDYPNMYAFMASEWINGTEEVIILLEKLH